jgi:hypothetical protein
MYFHDSKIFFFALRNKFYPLGYKDNDLIEWKILKLIKGHMVQEYRDEFCKMELMLNIPLHTQEMCMKYIGGLRAHIHNIVFMFGPTNLDEVLFKKHTLKQGKQELVYQGNHLQGKMTK